MFLGINEIGQASKRRKKEKAAEMTAQNTVKQQQQEQQQQLQQLQQPPERAVQCAKIITSATGVTEADTTDMIASAASVSTISAMTSPATTPTAKLIDNMLLGFSMEKCKNCQHTLQYQEHQMPPPPPLSNPDAYPCESDQNVQQSEQLISPPSRRVPCHCDCQCENKSFSSHIPNNPPPMMPVLPPKRISLATVYICLGTLTFALATLSVFFYSHVSNCAMELPNSPLLPARTRTSTAAAAAEAEAAAKTTLTPETNSAFREQFRRELVASDHVLRSIVARILREEYFAGNQRARHDVASDSDSDNESTHSEGNFEHQRSPTETVSNFIPIEEEQFMDEDETQEVVKNERKRNPEAQRRLRRRDISSAPSSMHADPLIEFFNPNHRKALEEQDMEIRKRTGLKGAAPGGDDWIYLNTYCRVPEKIITGFCKSTQEYCPPSPAGPIGPVGPKGSTGVPGLPGIPGPKGNRGDIGLPGPIGLDGPPGPRGPKGDIGVPGRSGLDGRDGVPGEPGLDGVPGRAGADGVPGKDGIPGKDGRDGKDGKDGKDGAQGPKGAHGPPGERGLRGIAGPRGRTGKSGSNGTPGLPGINTWKVQFANGSYSTDLLIPPSIADSNAPFIQRTLIVEEGKTLNLSCAAIGNPMPRVEWRRDDGRTININGVEMSSVSGQFLKFNNITRNQMAAYNCFADNGISPVANATYLIEVHFAPMISVYRQLIYAEYGHTATLECLVEAFPEAIRYWERAYDGKILEPGDKYRIESYPENYKTTMRLTITNLRKDDFGYYHCVARNELNATMANFEIAPQDPNSETPYVGREIKIYGQRPPESQCPVCEHCPDPMLYQCKDSINSNFDIQPTANYSYPGLPKRQKSCLLYAVGKPVFHKNVNEIYGCWLKDPAGKEIDREKTFVTNENDAHNLYEFPTKMQYRKNSVPRKKYEIREGFHGNAHVVYNGSFYYNQRNTDLVVKLDLMTLKKITTQLPYAGIAAGNKLYSTDYNYMDFSVDEVGLWVIYSTYDSNNTLVAKLDSDTLRMQYNFNITLDHRKFGEMFIVCGHLYAIDSCTDKNSQIRYVVDLYNGKLLNVDLPFSNPFRKTTTVGYNPYTVELYSWDKGNALTYPIRYHEQLLGAESAKREMLLK